MIEVRGLVKQYGAKIAVNDLSFDVEPGHVTGFLGPNGAGKTTTMRLILGLDYPDAGTVMIDGKQYAGLAYPMREVGALIDAKAVHGGRSAYNHLLCLAQTNNLPKRRVGEVLELVGLTDVARKRTRGFSLGMSQRLGIAGTLLGDPAVLMFDEPVNGLDPEGILWIRNLMKALAAEGRTVFVSSHLMSEMENTADHLIVIGRGSLLADCTMEEFIARSSGQTVRVRTPQPDLLAKAVSEAIPEATRAGVATATTAGATTAGATTAGVTTAGAATARPTATTEADGSLTVHGLTAAQVGDLAFDHGVRLHELTVVRASLEAAFMELTADSVEYRAGEGPAEQPAPVSEGAI
jgi:ABC-2 type transport system ATP-binding protein